MANEFYVAPFGGIDVGARVENILTGARQRKKEMDWEKEAPEVIQSRDPDRIADLMIRYPEMQPQITAAMGVKRPATMNKITSVAQKGLIEGGDPKEYLAEIYKTAIDSGDTDFANNIQSVLEKEFKTPGYASGFFQRTVAMNVPEEWNKIKDLMPKPEAIADASEIKASEILEDGTLIQSTPQGPVVYNPEGQRVRGKAAADAVKMARAEKVANVRSEAGARKEGALREQLALEGKVKADIIGKEEAAKISVDAYDKLKGINQNIADIDEAIRMIDEGAKTGFIEAKLPSIRQASIKLDNLQGRLGLNIIRNTTFGSLSEAELNFALATALPTTLKGEPLKKWLQDKKAAQEKLADYIESAAIYLGTPGNTVTGWMEKKRSEQETTEVNDPLGIR